MIEDALSHAFGFLSVVGLLNARQVSKFWLASSLKVAANPRVSLSEVLSAPGPGLVVHELVVWDDLDDVANSRDKLRIHTETLTLDFVQMTHAKLPLWMVLFERVDVSSEVRFQFQVIDEYCTDDECAGALCRLLRWALPQLEECLVEIPWRLAGYLSAEWCFQISTYNLPRAWRLRGLRGPRDGENETEQEDEGDEEDDVWTSSEFFGHAQVGYLELADIDFRKPCNAERLMDLGDTHAELGAVKFIDCHFPERQLLDAFESLQLLFERCEFE